jgi:hypothetical protein
MGSLIIGTSAFTGAGWPGAFYPKGLPEREYLTFYATKFDTVEVDSTFYRTPALTTVQGWGAPGRRRASLRSSANAGPEMVYLRARNRAPSFELGRLSESPSNLIHLGRRPDSRESANAGVAVPPALMLS